MSRTAQTRHHGTGGECMKCGMAVVGIPDGGICRLCLKMTRSQSRAFRQAWLEETQRATRADAANGPMPRPVA